MLSRVVPVRRTVGRRMLRGRPVVVDQWFRRVVSGLREGRAVVVGSGEMEV